MPVLDKEPTFWPSDLFDPAVGTRIYEQWRAFHVRPRTEKTVARYLRSHGIPYYLPQIERRKRYQRRLVCSHLVLFPGYVFALTNDQELDRPIESKAIIRRLPIDQQQQFESELRDIRRVIESGQPLTREERLPTGSYARITRGPLAGLCGQVVSNKRGLKFVLRVDFLQQGVSVTVDGESIEAL